MFNFLGSSGGPNLPVYSFYESGEEKKRTWNKKKKMLIKKGLSGGTIKNAKKQMFDLKNAFCKNSQGISISVLKEPLKTFLEKEEEKNWSCEEEREYYLLLAEKFCQAVNIKFSLLPKQLTKIFKKEGIKL